MIVLPCLHREPFLKNALMNEGFIRIGSIMIIYFRILSNSNLINIAPIINSLSGFRIASDEYPAISHTHENSSKELYAASIILESSIINQSRTT